MQVDYALLRDITRTCHVTRSSALHFVDLCLKRRSLPWRASRERWIAVVGD